MKDHKHKNDGIYDQMLEVGMVALALNNDRLERALLGTLKVNTKNNEEGNMWIC